MGVNFATLVYLPCQDFFGRDVTITPAGGTAYAARGIFDTRALGVAAENGAIISDQQTILDIREAEFATLPVPGDRVDIAADDSGPAEGPFEIIDATTNGGGETTLVLRKIETVP
jgi:hypothetical protein